MERIEPTNEVTMVSWLSGRTEIWADAKFKEGESTLIGSAAIESREKDRQTGHYRRCDLRITTRTGQRLVSGEFKRPESKDGQDARNESSREDARRKALWGGVEVYFTSNFRDLVAYKMPDVPDGEETELFSMNLSPMKHSSSFESLKPVLAESWDSFLERLEQHFQADATAQPDVDRQDVLVLADRIEDVVEEALSRAKRFYSDETEARQTLRTEAAAKFNFAANLDPLFPDLFESELRQILRFGVFVQAQKAILYQTLRATGPKREKPFFLDELEVQKSLTDPLVIGRRFADFWGHAMERTGDFESAFAPTPFSSALFVSPAPDEIGTAQPGAVWARLIQEIHDTNWAAIDRNIIGYLYELIVDPEFRKDLGQFYTQENVVDILTTFAIDDPADVVLDPASGGGSFLYSTYLRKRDLGDSHIMALESIWGFEITSFAAELSTVTLATADATAPAAYPRVVLQDFFDAFPGQQVGNLDIPDVFGPPTVPNQFDAVVGNPPYISYRHITNQDKIINALSRAFNSKNQYPAFSGKTDAYGWFLVHATQFLRDGGRLAFVVSSAILYSDYGIPLIRYIGSKYKIRAVVDSKVERWFPDADTNTVLLLLERCDSPKEREENAVRFVRLQRQLAKLLKPIGHNGRRQSLEDLVEAILAAEPSRIDPRLVLAMRRQGANGGLEMTDIPVEDNEADEEEVNA